MAFAFVFVFALALVITVITSVIFAIASSISIITLPLIVFRMVFDLKIFFFVTVADDLLAMVVPVAGILCSVTWGITVRAIIIDHYFVTAV